MRISKEIDYHNHREINTPGGVFFSFIPHLFKGDRGSLIMIEKKLVKKIYEEEKTLVTVREKISKDDRKYFVIRSPKNKEDKYRLFVISCGGNQDRREDYGHFKIKNIKDGTIIYDISSWWGENHQVLVALKKDGYVEIEGNHGAGFKGRHPQPDFLIKLNGDGSEEHITDLDID